MQNNIYCKGENPIGVRGKCSASQELLQVVRELGQVFREAVEFPVGEAVPLQVLLYILRVLREADDAVT